MIQSGRGGIGSRKYGKGGHLGHNRDMMQLAREVNRQGDERAEQRRRRDKPNARSVADLLRKRGR